ncbi:hypothetical protein HWV62_15469 [Athelia sp. TMB]|nr:hypothetical protein HWV62_15469 [Athelia sp. TMB]
MSQIDSTFTEISDTTDLTPEYLSALAQFDSTPARVQVRTIRFAQDSISNTFSDGTRLQTEIDRYLRDYRDAPARAEAIRRDGNYSVIRVIQHEGNWFSLDNRRLFVAKEVLRNPAGTGRGAGPIQEILVVRLTPPLTPQQTEEWRTKFHPQNNGLSIRFGPAGSPVVTFPA